MIFWPFRHFLTFIFISVSPFIWAQRQSGSANLQSFYPDDLSARNSFACGMGDAGACLPISAETVQALDSCAATVDIGGSLSGLSYHLLNLYADSVFFHELANRSRAATECQYQILSGSMGPVTDSAWRVYQTLQPMLEVLVQERDRESRAQEREVRSLSVTASDGAVAGVLNRRTERFQAIDAAIDQLLGQLPFGEHSEVKDSLKRIAGRNISQAQFNSAYTSSFPGLRTKFSEARDTFNRVRNPITGEYSLSFSQKTELYRSPGAEALLNQVDPSGRSLRCRFNSCYVNGPRNEQIAAAVGLGAVTVLTLGSASPFVAGAVAVGAASLSATQAYSSCFQDTFNATAEVMTSCTPENLARTTVSQMSATSCAVDASMALFDVALPGYAGARRLAQAARTSRGLIAADTAAEAASYGQLLRTTPDGSRVYRNAEGIEATISASGRKEFSYPNGSRVVEENGVSTTTFRDGSRSVRGADGVTTTQYADGTRSVRAADGTTTSYDRSGRVTSRTDARGNDLTEGIVVEAPGRGSRARAAAPESSPGNGGGRPAARDTAGGSSPRTAQGAELPDFDDADELRRLLEPLAERTGASVNELINEIQRGVRTGFDIDRDAMGIGLFLQRYGISGDEAARFRSLYDDIIERRQAITARNTEADRLNLQGNTRQRDVDCNALNRLRSTGDAFHVPSGCREVVFEANVNGQYCSCNQFDSGSVRSRRIGPWLTPCAASAAEYLTEMNQADVTALPDKNGGLNRCYKVDIPSGTRCFHGGLGPTFRGFGGLAQMYCGDERTPGEFSSLGNSLRPVNVPNGIVASRYAPIFSDPRLLRLTDAGRECLDASTNGVCSPEALARIRNMLEEIRGNAASTGIRNQELTDADIYLQYLSGRVEMDDLGNLRCRGSGQLAVGLCAESSAGFVRSPAGQATRNPVEIPPAPARGVRPIPTPAELENLVTPELRRVAALQDGPRVSEAGQLLGRALTGDQRRALVEAHNVGANSGRGLFTYTEAERVQKGLILRRAGFSEDETRLLLDRGYAGSLPRELDFGSTRALATSSTDRVRQMNRMEVDFNQLRTDFRSVARGYESEALRTTTPQFAREASRFYTRAGDRDEAVRLLQSGVSQFGMSPQRILSGLDDDLARINSSIGNGSNPALILERDTLLAVREEFSRRNGLARSTPTPAPGPQAERSGGLTVGGSTPPPRTPSPVATSQPGQPSSPPAPAAATSSPPPLVRPALRPVEEIPVDRAQQLANDYRLGQNGKPRDLGRSSELYYRATVRRSPSGGTETFAQSEARRTRGFSTDTQFMNNRNFSAAFMQSFDVDGNLAIRMLDDIAEAGGETRRQTAVNSFLSENFERFNRERFRDVTQRENFRRFVQHIRDNYSSGLSPTHRNYLSSWLTRQSE